MFRNKSVDVHQFAMVPRSDVPRSTFKIETSHKTTLDAGYLVPVYVDEVLPGDSFRLSMTAFGRLATPIVPIMDNLHLDSFFFFVPNRLVWSNWTKFMGEQENPDDSTSYLVPQCISPAGGYPECSIFDYMGLPTVGQVSSGKTVIHNALPLRAYNLIYNEWFRDENLQNSITVPKNDGPDPYATYSLKKRGKRHDYFTSALPWPQKGESVRLPLGNAAPVKGIWVQDTSWPNTVTGGFESGTPGGQTAGQMKLIDPSSAQQQVYVQADVSNRLGLGTNMPGIYADLSEATAATINQLRQSFQIQKLLERDARGGTRYTEIVRAHFGVVSPDARLQRPEYLGGGSTSININPVAQTSHTTADSTPQGHLAAVGTTLAGGHGFTQSFTEHGYIIGLVCVRADLTYQQGLRKMWSRETRYDFYFPAFAMLGEQAVLNKEIYCTGEDADEDVFGYQERWAEYRYNPAMITGLFRSTGSDPLDVWHLAQNFGSRPTLNSTFIEENPPLERVLAYGPDQKGHQLILDTFIRINAARPLPMYSVPGLIDHF